MAGSFSWAVAVRWPGIVNTGESCRKISDATFRQNPTAVRIDHRLHRTALCPRILEPAFGVAIHHPSLFGDTEPVQPAGEHRFLHDPTVERIERRLSALQLVQGTQVHGELGSVRTTAIGARRLTGHGDQRHEQPSHHLRSIKNPPHRRNLPSDPMDGRDDMDSSFIAGSFRVGVCSGQHPSATPARDHRALRMGHGPGRAEPLPSTCETARLDHIGRFDFG